MQFLSQLKLITMKPKNLDSTVQKVKKQIGKKLGIIRASKKLSQTDVGAVLDMTKQQVSKIERGEYKEMDVYIKEAVVLNVPFEEVLNGENEEGRPRRNEKGRN